MEAPIPAACFMVWLTNAIKAELNLLLLYYLVLLVVVPIKQSVYVLFCDVSEKSFYVHLKHLPTV